MQRHKWGNTESNQGILLSCQNVSDEYLWDFLEPQEYIEEMVGKDRFEHWIHTGGGFTLEDDPDPVPRFHKISVWAHHHREKDITWLALNIR